MSDESNDDLEHFLTGLLSIISTGCIGVFIALAFIIVAALVTAVLIVYIATHP